MDKHENAPGQNKEFTVKINGDEVVIKQHRVSYEELVKLSGLPSTDKTSFLVSYEKGVGNASDNISEGEHVMLKNGMVFDVSNCNRS